MVVCWVVVFFFFKQKTAYEMRISDWSSDVCSSDLRDLLGAEEVTLVYRRGPEAMGATGHEQAFARENGVIIRHWAQPVRLEGEAGAVRRVVFEHTCLTTAGDRKSGV